MTMNKAFINKFGITSNEQLSDLAKKLNIKLNFVGLTDNLKNITNGSYIINMGDKETNTSNGSHWTSLYVEEPNCLYMDSYAVLPEDTLMEILEKNKNIKKIIYNDYFQFQDISEQLCGVWCLIFLYHMNRNKHLSLIERFKNFTKEYKNLM